ncbi:MAG: hypothetical protein SFX73_37995 [Kofleriaceae bacterium]|nr:hypothetical protein [Kofleriaceae bacterium]
MTDLVDEFVDAHATGLTEREERRAAPGFVLLERPALPARRRLFCVR